MSTQPEALWQTKLHARLHDPAEKALILMRTAHGHEGGTSRVLQDELLPRPIPEAVRSAVKRADHWASAADRAAFPSHDHDGRYPAWQQVEFHKRPVVIHPLTGEAVDLAPLTDVEPAQAEALSLDHFHTLIHDADARRTALAFWRFGPDIDAPEIKSLWNLLPADTRVPDHSIWDHLDLTAALAGAFVVDQKDGPALLAVSLGPVQDFIAASRSTSDLWAGSHLLSRLAWEAMKVICEELGPEAILFPRLRGVPQVDVWLRDECGLKSALFGDCEWTKDRSDGNPLFAAALPNRFTALVPANRARALGERVAAQVHDWVLRQGEAAYRLLLEAAGIPDEPALPGYAQLREQLAGFPEVHWAAVPWSLIGVRDGRVDASDTRLAEAMQPFFAQSPPGFLGTDAWKILQQDIALEDGWFWKPNPGALYPALHELLERLLSATKAVRPFVQTRQEGWRCALTGETEWLTTDRSQLVRSYRQQTDTLWAKVAKARPAWARPGEHLGALATLKRLWPTLFVREMSEVLDQDIQRFVVSTHTMALATSLAGWLEKGERLPDELAQALDERQSRIALPRRLAGALHRHPDAERLLRLPGWLEARRESDSESEARNAERLLKKMLGTTPETYYALLLMDGDHMGAWLSADRSKTLPHDSSFHPQIRESLSNRFAGDPAFRRYAESLRAANPARHMAISDALNNFALTLAPAIVERHYGRVLYAGGDDVMAMLPVAELLPAMAALRAAYSGVDARSVGALDEDAAFTRQANGFVHHRGRLLRLMGAQATASIGAVVAHHQAPLGAVLRELRAAEKRAKNEGGRNAFSIAVIKRSGGALFLTENWQRDGNEVPMACLRELSLAFRDEDASRRAAYHVQGWSVDLPEPSQFCSAEDYRQMIERLLHYQFARQGLENKGQPILSARLARLIPLDSRKKALGYVNDFLAVAEFLARETRAGKPAGERRMGAAA